jgi:hypothetical protein
MHSVAPAILERPEWVRASASVLGRHGACCDRARDWLCAMARSYDFAATDGLIYAGPSWLAKRYQWGPTRWPIAWCEAVAAKVVDCGVFAAFARAIFHAKGIDAYPGQVLREFAEASTAHWQERWAAVPGAFNWIGERIVYHEVCVVTVGPDEARVYDPTDAVWLDPGIRRGHGSHVAIRAEVPTAMSWGGHLLGNGQWVTIAAN